MTRNWSSPSASTALASLFFFLRLTEIRGAVTFFVAVEALPNKLLLVLLLEGNPFCPKVVGGPLAFRAFTMLDDIVSLGRGLEPLAGTTVVFLYAMANHLIFKTHLLSLVLKVVLEFHPTRR